jgi:hypothetical protein
MRKELVLIRKALEENNDEMWERLLTFSVSEFPELALQEAKQAALKPKHRKFEEAAARCWGLAVGYMIENNYPGIQREILLALETSKPDSPLEESAVAKLRAFKMAKIAKNDQAVAKAALREQARSVRGSPHFGPMTSV